MGTLSNPNLTGIARVRIQDLGLNDLLDDQRARAVVNSEGTLGLLAASLLHNLV
jgi:hypothetical protein